MVGVLEMFQKGGSLDGVRSVFHGSHSLASCTPTVESYCLAIEALCSLRCASISSTAGKGVELGVEDSGLVWA
jgi:hypothetical protein